MFSESELMQIEEAVKNYQGSMEILERATGTFVAGKVLGWRVIKLIHGRTVWEKYQRIVGLKFEEVCPEETVWSRKSLGYKMWKASGKFWDILLDRLKVPGGKDTLENIN